MLSRSSLPGSSHPPHVRRQHYSAIVPGRALSPHTYISRIATLPPHNSASSSHTFAPHDLAIRALRLPLRHSWDCIPRLTRPMAHTYFQYSFASLDAKYALCWSDLLPHVLRLHPLTRGGRIERLCISAHSDKPSAPLALLVTALLSCLLPPPSLEALSHSGLASRLSSSSSSSVLSSEDESGVSREAHGGVSSQRDSRVGRQRTVCT